jgi:hypothetical protein
VPPQPWRWARPALGGPRPPKCPARDRRTSVACVTPSVTPLFTAIGSECTKSLIYLVSRLGLEPRTP